MAGTYKSSFCSQKVVRTINPYYLVKTFTFLYSQLVGLQKLCNRDSAVVNVPYEAYGETFVTKYLITVLHLQICFYWPQQSCGQGNIFTPVCHSVHRGVSASVHAGIPPPRSRDPLGADTPPRADNPPGVDTPWSRPPQSKHPPGADTPPRSRHPPGADIPGVYTPQEQTPPRGAAIPKSRYTPTPPRSRHLPFPLEADSGIRSMSGRYASYWNVFLLNFSCLYC